MLRNHSADHGPTRFPTVCERGENIMTRQEHLHRRSRLCHICNFLIPEVSLWWHLFSFSQIKFNKEPARKNKSFPASLSSRQEQARSSNFPLRLTSERRCACCQWKRVECNRRLTCEVLRPPGSRLCQWLLFTSQLYFLWQNCGCSVFLQTRHEQHHSCVGVGFFLCLLLSTTLRQSENTLKTNQGSEHLIFVFTIYATASLRSRICTPEHCVQMRKHSSCPDWT